MQILEPIKFIFVICLVVHLLVKLTDYIEKRYSKKQRSKNRISTRQLLRETITAIGCNYRLDDDEDFLLEYKEHSFIITAEDDNFHRHILIRDPWWGSMDINDNDVPLLKTAINECNITCVPTTVYTISDEHKKIAVHSQLHFNFNEERGNYKEILAMYLDSFFVVHNEVANKIQQMKQEQATQTERKVIRGFGHTTS